MHHPDAVVRANACRTFSNLLTGPSEMVQHLLDVVPSLIQLAAANEPKVRKEAMWAISNDISAATPERTRVLIEQNVLSELCALLHAQEGDTVSDQLMSLALEGVETLLTNVNEHAFDEALFTAVKASLSDPESGIVHNLTDLIQHSEVVEIKQRAARLWLRYFQ